jgi:murein DD-endopeptidase MepM/ murein hydrolase activator NlpD
MDRLSPALLAPYILRGENAGSPGAGAPGSLPDVAQEFEAQFIYQLLRQMRASMSLDTDESGGFGADTMGATIDVELARQLSEHGGMGLAKMIAGALNKQGTTLGADKPEPGRATEARRHGDTQVPELRASVSPSLDWHSGRPEHGRGAWPATTAVPAVVTALFDAPVTSQFGWRNDPFSGARKFHSGVDIAMAYGVEVPAVEEGNVIAAGEQGRYGNTVVLEHPSGARTRYAHLSEITVRAGQAIAAGETLGRAGRSGAATGPHLHFEVIVDSQRMDPLSPQARASLEEHP